MSIGIQIKIHDNIYTIKHRARDTWICHRRHATDKYVIMEVPVRVPDNENWIFRIVNQQQKCLGYLVVDAFSYGEIEFTTSNTTISGLIAYHKSIGLKVIFKETIILKPRLA